MKGSVILVPVMEVTLDSLRLLDDKALEGGCLSHYLVYKFSRVFIVSTIFSGSIIFLSVPTPVKKRVV